jgi:citrate synthase
VQERRHLHRRRRGILRYRGYPIEELAENSDYLESRLPDCSTASCRPRRAGRLGARVTHHTIVHESIKKFMDGFRYDAHPMGMLVSTVAALSTFYPEARDISDPEARNRRSVRLIAKMPTIAAFAYRHSRGPPVRLPRQRPSASPATS